MKKKNIYLLLAILSLIVFIVSSNSSYAKYRTRENAQSASKIKRWDIVLNNTHLNENKPFETQLSFNNSQYVATGKIAPKVSAGFDITIDYTNVDVQFFSYTLRLAPNSKIPGEIAISNTDSTACIDTTASTNKIINKAVNIEWSGTNDENDTELGKKAETVNLKIEAIFKQEKKC